MGALVRPNVLGLPVENPILAHKNQKKTKKLPCPLKSKTHTHTHTHTIMDIDDILADLGPSPLLSAEIKDLQALTRAWVTERCAPEILPWPESLMERVLERINAQVF